MFIIFILVFIITALFTIYTVINYFARKASNKNDEENNGSTSKAPNILAFLMIITFIVSHFVWNDKGEKTYVTETLNIEKQDENNTNDNIPDSMQNNDEKKKVVKYQILGEDKVSGKNEQQIIIKIFEDVSKNDMKEIITEIAKNQMKKINVDILKIVVIEDNKIKLNQKKNALSEMEYKKDGTIINEKYFVNTLINQYSDKIKKIIQENINIYEFIETLDDKKNEIIENVDKKVNDPVKNKYNEIKETSDEIGEEIEKYYDEHKQEIKDKINEVHEKVIEE